VGNIPLVHGNPRVTRRSESVEDWQATTPTDLVPAIEHIRTTFDESVWKCSEITKKLCFAALHPDDKDIDLQPYEAAFISYRTIIGPRAAQQFDNDRGPGTPPAIFHAFLQALAAGIRTEVGRLFNDVLQIGIAHKEDLKQHPADWAKSHLAMLINGNKHIVRLWIQSVCDKQDYTRPTRTDQEFEDFIHWRDWRAPKLIYMRPSGNLPYDPSAAWTREDEQVTEKLLASLSARVVQSLGFDLDTAAGRAHVELAKMSRNAGSALEGDDRRFAQMAIEKALMSVSEDDRPHPKVGAVADDIPTAFISYSWDGPEHKDWVLRLAERLRAQGGVRVILDRWNLGPGEDRTHFMEESIRTSDFVLIVCTPAYATKANNRAGGVGYEAMIITSQLAQRIQQNKFIPVLRSGKWDDSSVPIWLQSKIGVDLRSDPYKEDEYGLLLRALHRAHLKPPPVGPKPVFSERGASFSRDLLGNAVSAVLESVSNKVDPPLGSAGRDNEDRPKLSPVAYAFYETKGADARRVQAFVRPTDATGQSFRFETSTGERLEGTDTQVAQQYLAFDLDLRKKGYSRMQTFDGFGGPIFRLPS